MVIGLLGGRKIIHGSNVLVPLVSDLALSMVDHIQNSNLKLYA